MAKATVTRIPPAPVEPEIEINLTLSSVEAQVVRFILGHVAGGGPCASKASYDVYSELHGALASLGLDARYGSGGYNGESDYKTFWVEPHNGPEISQFADKVLR